MGISEQWLALQARLGAAIVSDSASVLDECARDNWPAVRKWGAEETAAARAGCVVRARSEADIVTTLKYASANKIPVFPRAAGSAVTGAGIPTNGAIVLDVTGLNRILEFDTEDGLITVECGVLGGVLEAWLEERGYTTGHYPQSLHISTVGGWVATRSSGTFSTKYGGIERLVAGFDVVLGDGRMLSFPAVPRAAAGPSLMQLFLGAEGTLGVVTRVTLRVARIPENRTMTSYVFDDLVNAVAAVRAGYAAHIIPAVLRLYDATEARGLMAKAKIDAVAPLLLVGHEGAARMAKTELEVYREIMATHGGQEIGTAVPDAWLVHRYNAEWFEAGNTGAHRMADSIEVCPKWSQLLPLYDAVRAEAGPYCKEIMAHWSHFYPDGCGVYFIFTLEDPDKRALLARYHKVWSIVMNLTVAHGAAISHHHGIGQIRQEWIGKWLDGATPLFQAVKDQVDPSGILSPGRLGLSKR